jgi:CO/xanthine dehydrogenase Mo-binding subunit
MNGSRVVSHGTVGESAVRIDAVPKVTGTFTYGSDLSAPGMCFGTALRSPHPSARISAIELSAAWRAPGVIAIMLAGEVPGKPTFGLEIADQPVLALDRVRYAGEPVALVAAETAEQAHAAAALIEVSYQAIPGVFDMTAALDPQAPQLHDFGNVLRHVHINRGELESAGAEVSVEGYYETAMQDQAALGPEAGLAIPRADGGVDLYVTTQWLHMDRAQISACLGLPEEQVGITLAGVGGSFGSREDIHMHIHACLLALRSGRPVKMTYGREESFNGHVHRHPSRTWIKFGATRAGKLVSAQVRLLLDGGAYASSSPAVIANASTFAAGPYEVPNVRIEGTVVYTNNPPCGAMRGFGAPQVCFAYEAAMDKLAAKLGLDPIELRLRNVLKPGSTLPTGQVLGASTPVREVIERCASLPLPAEEAPERRSRLSYPGGSGNVGRGESLRRGVGFAVGFKNVAYSEGFDDSAEATVTLREGRSGPVAGVHTAAVDFGQGLTTVLTQIVRSELGVQNVVVHPADTSMGSAGSTSASRQTTMTGGAVLEACRLVRAELKRRGGSLAAPGISCTAVYHHRPTQPFDAEGQGDIHVAFSFVAERAVVEVDLALGLVRVVELAVAQDVGRVINPQGAEGQVEGASAMGLGLALMEEIRLDGGVIANASFTDYLIPTMLDMPPVLSEFVEIPEPGAPYGVKGIGELATVAATAAIVAALRSATGQRLNRAPVLPDDLVGLRPPAAGGAAAPVPDVPTQQAIPEYHGFGLGQQELMKGHPE